MDKPWLVVPRDEAFSHAGTPAQTLPPEGVTYVVGPSAMLVIVDAGDRPDGNAVQSADSLTLHAPFPDAAETWLDSTGALFGFVRVSEGYVPLGKLARSESRRQLIDGEGKAWPFGGRASRTWCRLRIANKLGFDVLDQIRPMVRQPLPGVDWLRWVGHDPVTALRDFIAGWYADIPPSGHAFREPADLVLPEPLIAFYRAAAGRQEVYGGQNKLLPAGMLRFEHDGRLVFGSENQGVFDLLLNPAESDPMVEYAGINVEHEREPLSAFLLQFLLCEASVSSPFRAFATVTGEQASRLVEPLDQVPLAPMRTPVDPTQHYVAPGLVIATSTYPDGSVRVEPGSRHRSGLRPTRDTGIVWDRYDG